MVSVEFRKSASKELEEMDTAVGVRIVEKIAWLQQNFATIVPERLHYGLREYCKLRVGDYRVMYSLTENIIMIEMIRHRREMYK